MKKKHPEHVNLERWLVSYADFITLLFAFFVVMYSIANQDKAKIKQITEAIARTFNGPSTMLDMGSGASLSIFSSPQSDLGQVIDSSVGRSNARPASDPELQKIANLVEESLSYQLQTTDLKDNLKMIYDDRGLVIRFSAPNLYRPGQDYIEKTHLPIIDKVAEVLNGTDRMIRVEGHTDDSAIPADTLDRFPTLWELSSARSIWVVRYMKAKFNLPSSRLSASGFADGQPIASNKTPEGKSKNGRIEIVVTNLRWVPKN